MLKGKKDKRKSTFFLNKLATRFLEKKITKMGIGLTKAITKDIKKEEIKDKKDKEAENQKNLQSIKDNAEKSIKASMDEIKIKISIEDISIIEPFEKETYKKLDDLLLRNLSLISKLYILQLGVKKLNYQILVFLQDHLLLMSLNQNQG